MHTTHQLPTGYLIVGDYSKGKLETLSIADYGKAHNIKADFLGYTKPINGVASRPCLPLTEKWVITLSTQFGCPMKCTFCDVPNIPYRGNASVVDLLGQMVDAIQAFPSVKYTDRLNIHFARMGEPAYNPNVLEFTRRVICSTDGRRWIYSLTGLRVESIHPVFTTSMPRGLPTLHGTLISWCQIKNLELLGAAGLQLSINSTDDAQRDAMFRSRSLSLETISEIATTLPNPVGRKYCLNFALSHDSIVDASKLASLFNSEFWMVKITPIHNNNACRANGISTPDGYESFRFYEPVEERLKAAGFDVIVFVPSQDEEDGLVTCGNAILGGGKLKKNLRPLSIEGVVASDAGGGPCPQVI